MKQITIAGRLGRDAELRSTSAGPVLGFSVAVDDGRGQDKRTLWFDCTIWGKRGEALAQHLTKGTSVTATGDFSTREHNGKTYLQCRVDNVTMQGGGQRQTSRDPQEHEGSGPDFDSEIPFAPQVL